jgi:hypothetical protein
VFLVDETGSMGSHIDQVKQRLLDLVPALQRMALCRDVRLGLVVYRDHPPQDRTYASKAWDLTADIAAIETAVRGMYAQGGGDAPEAVTDGLVEVVRLAWRPDAARTVVWFGDAPPHGVGLAGDGFPEGCPCGHRWYVQAESCREMGIAITSIDGAQGSVATEVFRIVAHTTRGLYLPLRDASLLVPLIAGAVATALDKQRIEARVRELMRTFAGELAQTDEQERVRWLLDALREDGVRPRVTPPPAGQGGPSPLSFRPLAAADVEGALERLPRAEVA